MSVDELHAAAIEIRFLTAIITKVAGEALEQRLETHCGGLSHLQFGIMLALSFEDLTISELSRKFRLTPSTLVPAVDALERKGLARRQRDPADRRRAPIGLTERGREVILHVPAVDSSDPLLESLSVLGPDHSRQLLELLREVVRHMPDGENILREVKVRLEAHAGINAAVGPTEGAS